MNITTPAARLPYPDFDADEFNQEVPLDGNLPAARTIHAYRRLSPFNAPENVVLEVRPSEDALTVYFIYPNEEPSEQGPRGIDSMPHISVLLGRYTKKILRFCIQQHAKALLAQGSDLLPVVTVPWANEVSEVNRFACHRNAEVVSEILRSMPTTLRQEVVAVIDREQSLSRKTPTN